MKKIVLTGIMACAGQLMAQVDPRDFIPTVNSLPLVDGQFLWNSQLSNYAAFYPATKPVLDSIRAFLPRVDAAKNNPAEKAALRDALINDRVRRVSALKDQNQQRLMNALYDRLLARLG